MLNKNQRIMKVKVAKEFRDGNPVSWVNAWVIVSRNLDGTYNLASLSEWHQYNTPRGVITHALPDGGYISPADSFDPVSRSFVTKG